MSSTALKKSTGKLNRNRLLNPDGYIDQRNNGGLVTAGGGGVNAYTVDRYAVATNVVGVLTAQQDTTTVLGTNQPTISSHKINVAIQHATPAATDDLIRYQPIETCRMIDSLWGTANAKTFYYTVALSVPVAGIYSVAFVNYAQTRSFVSTITVANANTLEFHTIAVPGDTTGTWSSTPNAGFMYVIFDLGCGSNYTTSTLNQWQTTTSGIYKAAGSLNFCANTVSTSMHIAWEQFEPDYATEPEVVQYDDALKACQRYFEAMVFSGTANGSLQSMCFGAAGSTSVAYGQINYNTPKRAIPSSITWTGSQPQRLGGEQVTGFVVDGSVTGGLTACIMDWTAVTTPFVVGNASFIYMAATNSGTLYINSEI